MKLIADRLLLSRACFLLGFTIVKLNKNKMKKVLKTLGLQHRRDAFGTLFTPLPLQENNSRYFAENGHLEHPYNSDSP